MKIAHVTLFYTPTICGVKQVVEELAKRQVKAGHEVHVYASDWDKNQRIKPKEETIEGIYVHRCRHLIRIANFEVVFPSLFFKLIKKNFDIIHTHIFGHTHFILSALVARLKKIPHIHTTHCPWTEANRSLAGKLGVFLSYNILSKISSKFVDKVIAITPWELSFIKKYFGKQINIEIIPNGMSEEFFKKIKNNDFKKKNQIKNRSVLFFGRLNKTKGPDKFVEIAKLILKERNDITFVIVGPDEGMEQKIKQMISNEKKIKFLGKLESRKDVIKMYQAADVYVMPSFREGLPLTLFEAMASGLPIVASPVNGIPFELKEGENGFLVKYGDNEGFKKRILELLDNQKLRERISENNIKKAKQYSWDIIFKKTMELYEEALVKQ